MCGMLSINKLNTALSGKWLWYESNKSNNRLQTVKVYKNCALWGVTSLRFAWCHIIPPWPGLFLYNCTVCHVLFLT